MWRSPPEVCEACGIGQGGLRVPSRLSREERSLASTFERMNCRRLLTMLQRTLFLERPAAQAAVDELVQSLFAATGEV